MADDSITARVDSAIKKKANEMAEREGATLSRIVERSLEVYTGFQPWFYKRLRSISESAHYPEWAILQKCVVHALAELEAELTVWDHTRNATTLSEFISTSDGPYVGELYYESERQNIIKALENEKFNILYDDYQKWPDAMLPENKEYVEQRIDQMHEQIKRSEEARERRKERQEEQLRRRTGREKNQE